jgi:hypothetical protein
MLITAWYGSGQQLAIVEINFVLILISSYFDSETEYDENDVIVSGWVSNLYAI